MGRKKKKKGAAPPNPADLPPLPLPPSLPAAIPPPPTEGLPLPPLEGMPPPPVESAKPRGALEGAAAPKISSLAPPDMSKENKKDGYDSLWKRGSSKPLKQVYGHIDRLGEGEVGSLLDRYADRFGHQLDREIIVKRKAEHDSKIAEIRDAPTITLLDEDEEEEIDAIPVEEETSEVDEVEDTYSEDEVDDTEASDIDDETLEMLNSKKSALEAEIKKLKPKYQLAKQKNQASKLKKLKPKLEALLSERKSIAAVIDGDAPLSSLEEEEDDYDEVESEDLFIQFVSIIDNLLGKLPDTDAFIRSDEFTLYAAVAGNPSDAGDDQRTEFFQMVDSLLLELPEDEIQAFMQSGEFAIYSEIGATYGV